jgi:AraC-like DNA-binding protein
MPISTISVFSEADDFQAALKDSGCFDLIANHRGKFRAHLTRITLYRMGINAGDERQARVAFLSIPPNSVRVTLPPEPDAALICSGLPVRADEIVTHSADYRFHERTEEPCCWGTIWARTNDLIISGHAMSGTAFTIPTGECRWQPPPIALRRLIDLHADAVRATTACPRLPVDDEAARGLEQQLLGALMDCLIGEAADQGSPSRRQHAEIMARFEDAVRASPAKTVSLATIRASLGVSETTLRKCCHAYLGMGPTRYSYRHRMDLINRALRQADHTETNVADVAGSYGFNSRDGFSLQYQHVFGELPSVTLRRQPMLRA